MHWLLCTRQAAAPMSRTCLQRPHEARRIGANARRTVEERFTPSIVAQIILARLSHADTILQARARAQAELASETEDELAKVVAHLDGRGTTEAPIGTDSTQPLELSWDAQRNCVDDKNISARAVLMECSQIYGQAQAAADCPVRCLSLLKRLRISCRLLHAAACSEGCLATFALVCACARIHVRARM